MQGWKCFDGLGDSDEDNDLKDDIDLAHSDGDCGGDRDVDLGDGDGDEDTHPLQTAQQNQDQSRA